MKKLLLTVAAVATLGLVASQADAQCAFNRPGKAKGLKSDMVRVYAPCAAGTTYMSTNTTTASGTPACTPPIPLSDFEFTEKGSCSVKSGHKLEDPCSDGSGDACANITLQAKCGGVNDNGGTPIGGPTGAGWGLNVVGRATTADSGGPDVTIFDFPIAIPFPEGSKGKLKLKAGTNDLLAGLGLPALNGCSNVEVVTVKIVDPAGGLFANLGSASTPK